MIVAGGTGGHVYPALATAEAIIQQYPDAILSFVGNVGGFERPLIEHANIPFASHDEVQSGPIHGVNPLKAASSLLKLGRGTSQALRILRQRQPQAILSTGGWASLPVALAASIQRIPMLIYLPDVEPGLTIKVLQRFAKQVAVTVDESQKFFKEGQTIVTGYPLRGEMMTATRSTAIPHFGLNPDKKTVLVFGGSRGARAINIALESILPDVLALGNVQVLHITGTLDWKRSQSETEALHTHPDYHAYAYLHDDMALAYAVADLAICRAGASILGEFPFFKLPAILIPLAYQWHYQQVNADYLASRGAAIHMDETTLDDQLLTTIQTLVTDSAQLDAMRVKIATLAQPEGAANVAKALAVLAQGAG
jgi:UDP-N-acetylglucosamine--N-acetylmuramyl-(pentapeptide) pyrophosphoryl-undecaprenol N-acetylglucosamine transferase